MVRGERELYREEIKERLSAAYHNRIESAAKAVWRYQVSRDTVGSCVNVRRKFSDSEKRVKLATSRTDFMKKEELYPEVKEARIRELGGPFVVEKLRSEHLEKMKETAGREKKIAIRKKLRSRTFQGRSQEESTGRAEVLCRLSDRSRQVDYERLRYVAVTRVKEVLFLGREDWKDFPQKRSGKQLIYLSPKFEAKHQHISRAAIIELPYRRFNPDRKAKNRFRTTFPNHRRHKYTNLTSGYTSTAPNLLWVSDITSIETGGEVSCFSLITDTCSHRIIGWNQSRTPGSPGSPAVLEMTLKALNGKHPEPVSPSDRGIRYCCNLHVGKLGRKDIQISMTESGVPREKAMEERISSIPKTVWIYGRKRSCSENSITKKEQ
jgi:transposase InsO family protein